MVLSQTLLDVTDLVEFWQRRESVSGVQRVVESTAPLLLAADPHLLAVVLDRARGVFIAMTRVELATCFGVGPTRAQLAERANSCLARARTAPPVRLDTNTVLVFLGAVWINDALMLAARDANAKGAKLVYLLYDLTPVLETGHTAAVNRLFERYLNLVLDTACRVPSISSSSRNDLVAYAVAHGAVAPAGSVTGLPCGIVPGRYDTSVRPWPRPYALFVGTVEARKNHLLVFNTWRELIDKYGADAIPDLVCVGRLGWHADEFLRTYVETGGLGGKVSLLSTSVSDGELAAFYANAEFTVYPSRYEGWGLPVSESLAFGKVPVVAHNSALPEAGGDLATYFTSGEVADLTKVIEREVLNLEQRARLEQRIRDEFVDLTWQQVADVISQDIEQARSSEGRKPMNPIIELGREYVLATGAGAPDSGYADQLMRHLQTEGLTPMLRQPRGTDDFKVVDAALVGTFGSPQTWGLEIRPGNRADFRFTRPVDGPLTILISTRSMPGVVRIDAVGPGGPVQEQVYLGSVISLRLGAGKQGEPAQVTLSVTDATDSIEGFLGIRSFVVLAADDLQTQVLALRSAADALRQELDFVTNTRSWKVTAPLRKLGGRGTN